MAGDYAPCISKTFPSWIRRCSLRPQQLLKQKPARRSRGCRRSRVSQAMLPRCRACRPRLRRTATPAAPAQGAPRHSGSRSAPPTASRRAPYSLEDPWTRTSAAGAHLAAGEAADRPWASPPVSVTGWGLRMTWLGLRLVALSLIRPVDQAGF